MDFKFENEVTGEVKIVRLTPAEIQEELHDHLFDKLADNICSCQPIGETNVVVCNCEDIIEQFRLTPRRLVGIQ